uniref:Rap-GAP domain-containing protein n=1 Tax=Acrobeloides nanus TaxID=290746 RepID=A0A914DYP7_9BILA
MCVMKNASAAARGSHNHNNSSTTSSNVGINATEPRGGGGVGIIAGGRSIFHRPNSMLSVSGTTEPVPSPTSPYIGYFSAKPQTTGSDTDLNNFGSRDEPLSDWQPPYPRLCAYHDCHSLAAAWGLGPPTTSLENAKPTGASQAQSPSEDDPGDGKTNDLVQSCPAFRNEIGIEPIRRLPLSRYTMNVVRISNEEDSGGTWQREHTAAEIGVLEDVSNVYLGGRLCASRQSKIVIEPQDIGSYYFRHCFAGRSHVDYFGTDDQLGPVAVSMVREVSEKKQRVAIHSHTLYRIIVRISDLLTMRVAVPEEALPEGAQDKSNRALMRELLELVCPQIHFGCLRPSLPNNNKVEELLLKVDEQPIYTRYKVGVLYCKAGQSTEEQMYNNEHSSPAFEEFLDFLGNRVRLKGFDSYKGGLDTRGDTTGEYSIYTEYHSHEIMFHVSTMLPFTPNNRQQLSRKRHIGNDMVTIIFQEPGALSFSPITVRSHFQHVFIIVRVNNPCTDNVTYSLAVSRAKDVPAFGPPIQPGATYQKCAEFHDFLLTKIINAENAVHRSKKFASMAARTRREALKDLAENYVTAHPNEGPSRIASRFLGGSVKRKERPVPKPALGANIRGALSWLVEVHDHTLNQKINCIFGVSAENIVLLGIPSGDVLFATPTHSILGWANTDLGLKLYYDHGEMLLLKCATPDGSDKEMNSLLRRLEAVTNGEEAKELMLRKTKPSDSYGFHIQEEGVVTDVEMYQTAWRTGLRQGSRVVELENVPVITMSLDQMTLLLEERTHVRILMIAPTADGNPRRGCEDPNCPAVKGQEAQILTPDTFAKQPMTYQEMFKVRNREFSSTQSTPQSSFEERFNFSKLIKPQEMYLNERSGSINESQSEASTPGFRDKKKGILSSVPPIPPRTYKKNRELSNSVHDQLYESISPRSLDRAQSDEALRFYDDSKCPSPQVFHEDASSDQHHVSFDSELAKYQYWLQKALKERKELELLCDQLKAQLALEKRAHDGTKKQLQFLQQYCERLSLLPPEAEDDEEL